MDNVESPFKGEYKSWCNAGEANKWGAYGFFIWPEALMGVGDGGLRWCDLCGD